MNRRVITFTLSNFLWSYLIWYDWSMILFNTFQNEGNTFPKFDYLCKHVWKHWQTELFTVHVRSCIRTKELSVYQLTAVGFYCNLRYWFAHFNQRYWFAHCHVNSRTDILEFAMSSIVFVLGVWILLWIAEAEWLRPVIERYCFIACKWKLSCARFESLAARYWTNTLVFR